MKIAYFVKKIKHLFKKEEPVWSKMIKAWYVLVSVLAIVAIGGLTVAYFLGVFESPVYQVLVIAHDDGSVGSARLERGYVLGVYAEDHEWSDNEKKMYLILKIRLDDEQKRMITQPLEKSTDETGLFKKNQQNETREGSRRKRNEILKARKYQINLDSIGFGDKDSLINGQPFPDKIFSWHNVKEVR